ncbi:MAG TPA: CHAP domain-containing protein [Acetobacteraceae bacterium]|nr:CHAP domain-containing protein [Acetobacteraceae bacterium]
MRAVWFGGKLVVLGAALAMTAPLTFHTAEAARTRAGHGSQATARAIQAGMASAHAHYSRWGRSVARYGRGSWLQCVPFARENTGIELSGNANTWWAGAEGVYERGAKPEVGSVLSFRATGRMRMGHVAVVANVIDSRNIEIDHANWGRGQISRNMTVVDVSPNNDWTAVRVGLSTGDYGSIYPTDGFIYDRPDKGTMVANTGNAPTPVLNAAPRDLRPAADRIDAAEAEPVEVAEAADDTTPRYSVRHRYRYANARSHGAASGRAMVLRANAHTLTHKAHTTRRHRS